MKLEQGKPKIIFLDWSVIEKVPHGGESLRNDVMFKKDSMVS